MRPVTQVLTHVVSGALIVTAITSFIAPMPANPVSPEPVVIVQQGNILESNAQDIARELLRAKDYRCLSKLLTKESHWNPKAKNPTSTAIGIGQLLEGTYRNLGMRHSTYEVPQLVATLAYIGRRYGAGGPCAAWTHWKQNRWY
jgi:hypothetical protein